MKNQWVVSIGENRGKARLWLQGKRLAEAGFIAKETAFRLTIGAKQIVIEAAKDGDRHVSGKGDVPVIDINTAELDAIGGSGTRLNVTATRGKLILAR